MLAIGRLQATARDTGAAVEQRLGWIVTFDGERIAEFRTYPSAQAAREAAGLTE